MSKFSPTGSDVARLAGVSKSAVSRAYTGGLVSEDARKRIFDAAKQLKYRPNNTARSLTTRQSHMIGIAVTHLDNQFYPAVIGAFSEHFARHGYRLLLFVTHGEADLDPVMDELMSYRLDGVILASSSLAVRIARECRDAHVPVVMFNNVDPEESVLGVSCADAEGGALVARYLFAAGHKRCGMVTGLAQSSTSNRRCSGFRGQAEALGLNPPSEACGLYSFDGAITATHNLLDGANPPDAIFCANDHMALGALEALKLRGLRAGQDISLVGFDNVQIAQWSTLSLTTVAQPLEDMIGATVDLLLRAIAGEDPPARNYEFPGKLIIRDSARRAMGIERDNDQNEVWRG